MGPRAGLDRVGKILSSPGFDPQTVQPVTSRYTDWAIPAHGKEPRYLLHWLLGWPQSRSGRLGDERNHMPQREFETSSPARSPADLCVCVCVCVCPVDVIFPHKLMWGE
jgi:hypothetical protein